MYHLFYTLFIFLLIIIMHALLTIIMILAGIIFVGSVLLMSPKGGLGLGIGGMSGMSEYGSKKTMEGKLKKIAVVSIVVFILIAIILPYIVRS